MRTWMLRVGVALAAGSLLGGVAGCGHDPNHGIDLEKARAAARRVHAPPPPGVKLKPGGGG